MNTIIIVGRLGTEPEMRYTNSGQPVTNFSVADNRRYTGADGQPREETVWFRVTAWGRLAETCNQYLSQGRQVAVEGRMKPVQIWEGRDGQPRANLEVTARSVEFLGGASSSDTADPGEPPEAEDEIPF